MGSPAVRAEALVRHAAAAIERDRRAAGDADSVQADARSVLHLVAVAVAGPHDRGRPTLRVAARALRAQAGTLLANGPILDGDRLVRVATLLEELAELDPVD